MSFLDALMNDVTEISKPITESASGYLKDNLNNIIDSSVINDMNQQFSSLKALLPNTTDAVYEETNKIVNNVLTKTTTPEMSNNVVTGNNDKGQVVTNPTPLNSIINKTVETVKQSSNILLIVGAGVLIYFIYASKGRKL
jgi:carbamate kinase